MNRWDPLPYLSDEVTFGEVPLSLEQVRKAIESRRHLATLSPLQDRWKSRVFVHLWRNSGAAERLSFVESRGAVSAALKHIGRGIDALWLSTWLHQEFGFSSSFIHRDWEDLVARGIMRDGWTDDTFPYGKRIDRINPPVPPGGLLLEGRANEHLGSAIERWLYDLAELQHTLEHFPLPDHRGPDKSTDARNIEWAWQYLVQKFSYSDIAESFPDYDVTYIREYVHRVIVEVKPPAPRQAPKSWTAPLVQSYETFNGLLLQLRQPRRGFYVVTFEAPAEPERRKTLYEGGNKRKAEKEYQKTIKLYEERRAAEM